MNAMSEIKNVLGGIYKSKGDTNEEAEFAIMYNKSLCFLFDDINHVFSDVEHGVHGMEFVQGYCLAITKGKNGNPDKWLIRDSGRKNTKEHIIKTGTIRDYECFRDSLEPFFKAMSMS